MNELVKNYEVVGWPSVGNFDQYVNFVNQIPLLTQEQEEHWSKMWFEHQDLTAARQLILSHLRLVLKIAKDYKGYGLPQEDLVQEGNVGLMKAVKNFNPSLGRLFAYASVWIKSEIQEFIMNNLKMVKIGHSKNLKKLFFNYRQLEQKHQMDSLSEIVMDEKIKKELNVSSEDVKKAKQWFAMQEASLIKENKEGEIELIDLPSDVHVEYDVLKKEQETKIKEWLKEAKKTLNEKEMHVLMWRFEEQKTLQEVGVLLSISAEAVRKIEKKALQKMKKYMDEKGVSSEIIEWN